MKPKTLTTSELMDWLMENDPETKILLKAIELGMRPHNGCVSMETARRIVETGQKADVQ